ncbi:TonB-dependent receptor [Saccharicrinis sp. FJH62]|uniref:TonB-dependent receptor n=1 Tax=Saccharicrinis sp. FJH62 TaxID=3344657 RepID=UPI0035D5207E
MKVLLSLLSFFPFIISAQISGLVIDEDTQQPLEGAIVSSGSQHAATNQDGYFTLSNSTDTLKISLIGYQDKIVAIRNNASNLVISLSAEPAFLPEVRISITPFNDPLKQSSGSNFMIPVSTIEKQSDLSSVSLLNQVPGIYVQQGTLNTNRITIRGIGSRTPYATNRIKAYFGDIPLTNGDGVSVIEDMDLSGISRIEILKGPSSAIYGSGLGGVIRILPENNRYNGLTLQSSAASFNTFRHSATAGYSKGAFNTMVNYSNLTSGGFRENNKYRRHNIFLNSNFHSGKTHLLLHMIYTKLNAQIPSSLSYEDYKNHPETAASNWLAVKGYEKYHKLLGGISATTNIRKNWTNKASAYGGTFNQYESRPFDILSDKSVFWGFRERLIYENNKFKALLGTEYYGEKYGYNLFFTNEGERNGLKNSNNEVRQYINFFSYASYDILSDLKADAGLNLNILNYSLTDNYVQDNMDVSGNYTYKPILSPKIGWTYTASEDISFYLSAGHGFSHPSLEETLLPEGTVNPNLKPEQGYNIEAGLRMNLFRGLTYAELTVYKMYMNNLLVIKRETEDVFYAVNAGKTEHQGIELLLHQKIVDQKDGFGISYTGSLSLSDHYFTSFTDDNVDYSGYKLPGIPGFTSDNKLKISYKQRLTLSSNWFISGTQYLNDSNSGKAAGFSLINAQISCLLYQQISLKISIFGHVNNILDTRFASMILVNAPSFNGSEPRYYYPGEPRNMQAGIRLTF